MRTVGVEEELLLIDAASGRPRAVAALMLRDKPPDSPEDPPGGTLTAELQQQQIEIHTTPSTELDDVDRQIRSWRHNADQLARASGARITALATCPVPVTPETTVHARYQAMVDHLGLTTMEQLTCGCHVHVAVESDDEGAAVLDRIRIWLPALLALSANSPYWQGRDTGYASFRTQAWNRFPTAGPSPRFGSAAAYRSFVDSLVATGVPLDLAMIYLDARISERYPTVEIRTADVCLRADDAVLVAALARALVETAARAWRAGIDAPDVGTDLIRLASWRASRSGLSGALLDPVSGTPHSAAAVVGRLVGHVRAALEEAGDYDRVRASIERLSARGVGASIQRRLVSGGLSLAEMALATADIALT